MSTPINYSNMRRVLVVEDDKGWLELSKIHLTRKNYIVGTSLTKEQAIEELDRCLYHIAIVDLKLNDDDPNDREGLRVLEHIWKMNEGTRAIVRSGYARDISVINEMIKYGIKGLTEKDMGFVKGDINKGAETTFNDGFFDNIEAAVNEAKGDIQRAGAKTVWENSPFSFINGMLARDIQLSMGGGTMSELRGFLGELVEPCAPWLQAISSETLAPIRVTQHDKQNGIAGYQTICWSRAFGHAVLIRFGRKDLYEKNLQSHPLQSMLKIGEAKQLLWSDESQHFMGEVYYLDGADFRTNFRRPIPKRTPEH